MGQKRVAKTPKKYADFKENLRWQWLTDIPWFKKLPFYQQNQLWSFIFNRLNDLCMIMYHEDGIFPKIKEQAYEIIAKRNGHPICMCSPETIGSGIRSDIPEFSFSGCSDVYWWPIILACYDNFHNTEGTLTEKWVPEVKNKKLEL